MSNPLRNMLHFIKHEMLLYPYYSLKNNWIRRNSPTIDIRSVEETINAVTKDRLSVSRFGDGEFCWMAGIKQNTFQDDSEEMKRRLIEICKSNEKGHIVCLSDAFGSLRQYNHYAKQFWREFMVHHRRQWIGFLDKDKTYYNTNMTRLYMDYKDKSHCMETFKLLQKMWEGREVVIIEGQKTRLGVGNDLFSNTKSIKRILAPATNAFFKYDELLTKAKSCSKDKLILIALGPTATILAYDLYKEGYQSIDVGHVDIEYEWCLMRAKEKIPVPNKYVNEAKQFGGIPEGDFIDEKYQKEILYSIQ